MTTIDFHYYDENALLERLSKGLKKRGQEVIFLVGAPLSAPTKPGLSGVPGVDGTIDLIRTEFADDAVQLSALDEALQTADTKRYQAAFLFLQGRRGQRTANDIIRKAIREARIADSALTELVRDNYSATDEECRLMDLDVGGWNLNQGTEYLGKLATEYPNYFGKCILTTNFDPLIEVAIRRAGGNYFRTTLHSDGNLSQTEGNGCHVVHLHGYWYGSDTLHTARQLGQQRPRLRASLSSLLRNKLIVVCAYSGWDDTFTEVLMDIVRDDAACPEIIWTFYRKVPALSSDLSSRLGPGIDRGRVNLYSGIDCNSFFPRLYQSWLSLEGGVKLSSNAPSNPVRVSDELRIQVQTQIEQPTILEGDDEDRPPLVDICVGRDAELKKLMEAGAKVIFITGLGGQGKSTLASRYFGDCQVQKRFSFFVWRDCKEESERFENQLAAVIEKLSGGTIAGGDLVKQPIKAIVEILMTLIKDLHILFVFDNADHYVDLETEKMVGNIEIFIEALLKSGVNAKVVFTCRPYVSYGHSLALTCPLTGLDIDATLKLFNERSASVPVSEIEDAHHLTEGHAFWLDLLAIQITRRAPEFDFKMMLDEIRRGSGPLPENTLTSIWSTLKEREQIVLRALAEAIKPETEVAISDYLSHRLNYGKILKALKALRSLNLVVVKQRPDAPDVLELHPMVRRFIWQHFTRTERASYIDEILKVYKRAISRYRAQLEERPAFSILQYWTQNAELDIAAGNYSDAFTMLAEVAPTFSASAYSREFSRIARRLLSAVDWVVSHAKFKGFEAVFRTHLELLSYLGESAEEDNLLHQYEKTVPNRDARYINYCGLRTHSYWVRGDFTAAVKWGEIGQKLKDTGVDTQYDVSHVLALAQRDAGHPELALTTFLEGRTLGEAVDPEDLDEEKGGVYYGNVGRCLHFLGQVESALACYQKSALLIEKDPENEHVLNQGYIRAWVGELLVAKGQFKLSHVFFRAAAAKWMQIAPPKAIRMLHLSEQVKESISEQVRFSDHEAERMCIDWILGRRLDT